jgi:hypothetical protein
MDSIARFFRSPVNPTASPTRVGGSVDTVSQVADCVVILGPGVDKAKHDMERQAKQEGLKIAFIGDGESDITEQMITEARTKGIISANSEVICIFHGHIKKDKEGNKIHMIQTNHKKNHEYSPGEKPKQLIRTINLLHWLRQPQSTAQNDADVFPVWKGNIHIASCHVGELNKEFTNSIQKEKNGDSPYAPLWRQGSVITHGSNKRLQHRMAMENFSHLFRQLGHSKKFGNKHPEAADIFKNIMLGTADTVALLGGELNVAMVGHSPKTLIEAMPNYIQSRWMQLKADARLQGVKSVDKNKDTNTHKTDQSDIDQCSAITEQKIVGFIFNRIDHLNKREKLAQLKSELKQYPGLVAVRDIDGSTPLINLANKPFGLKNSEVSASDIAEILVSAGSDVNASNRNGVTALHRAVRNGNIDLVNFFLDHDARLDIRDKDGQTPLHLACLSTKNRHEVLKSIIQKYKPNEIDRRNISGKTALHLAILSNDLQAVSLLLEAGANPAKRTSGWDNAMDLAKRLKDGEKIVALLKSHSQRKKNAPN